MMADRRFRGGREVGDSILDTSKWQWWPVTSMLSAQGQRVGICNSSESKVCHNLISSIDKITDHTHLSSYITRDQNAGPDPGWLVAVGGSKKKNGHHLFFSSLRPV